MTAAVAAVLAAAGAWLVATGRRRGARRLGLVARRRDRPTAIVAVAGAVVLVAGVGVSAAVVAAMGCAGFAARVAWVRRAGRRLQRRRDVEAVTLCAALAAELRAGLEPAAALSSAATGLILLGPALARAARAVGHGALVGDELAAVAADARCPRLEVVAAVCAAGEATGSGVAGVLDRIGHGLAADDEAAAELDALSAGPRTTAMVLATLPVLAVAMAAALGLSPLRILLHTALGAALLLVAALLELAGLTWVHRITATALRH